MDLKGKTVLITGASSGIGLSTARAFACLGSQVVLVARTKEALDDLSIEIKAAGGYAIVITTDVTDRSQVLSMVKNVEQSIGRVDILINNAGIGLNSSVADMKISEFQRVLEVNLLAPLHVIQAILPLMISQKKGTIVNVLSISSRRAMPNSGAYCASKAALEMLSDSLRMELSVTTIKVVNVFPGFTLTPFADHALGPKSGGRGRRFAVSPERVARAIIKATQKEKRDTYVTLFDKIVIAITYQFPSLTDRVMERFLLGHSRR